MNICYFDEWKNEVIKQLSCVVNSLKLSNKRTLAVMNSEKHDLNILKSHFIMTGIDKARNNISFICKRYYLDNFKSELKRTNMYTVCYKNKEEIVKEHMLSFVVNSRLILKSITIISAASIPREILSAFLYAFVPHVRCMQNPQMKFHRNYFVAL